MKAIVTKERKLGPALPEHIKQALESQENTGDAEAERNKDKVPPPTPDEKMEIVKDEVPEEVTEDTEVLKRKRGDRGSKRRAKAAEESDQTEVAEPKDSYRLGEDAKYDVWVPPQDQSGDGKTSLNEKLGY